MCVCVSLACAGVEVEFKARVGIGVAGMLIASFLVGVAGPAQAPVACQKIGPNGQFGEVCLGPLIGSVVAAVNDPDPSTWVGLPLVEFVTGETVHLPGFGGTEDDPCRPWKNLDPVVQSCVGEGILQVQADFSDGENCLYFADYHLHVEAAGIENDLEVDHGVWIAKCPA